jgi:hypothetical protein
VSYFSTLSWENKLFFEWVKIAHLALNNNHSLTQKITCPPMVKLKNSSIGIKQQSLTHSKSNLFSHVSDCCLTPSELFFNFIMGEQVIF